MVTFTRTNSVFSETHAYTSTTGETINVASDGFLVSREDNGIWLDANNAIWTINIAGTVVGGGTTNAGILNSASNSIVTLTIERTGTVHGTQIGLALFYFTNLTNHGAITSGTATAVSASFSGDFTWTNTGLIASEQSYGISLQGSGNHTINNEGVISAGTDQSIAINCSTSNVGNETINNTGRIEGDVELGIGTDTYNGATGRIVGAVFGEAGTDTLIGGIDNDVFDGGTENDTLRGNAGSDSLNGGAGADQMTGGSGNDTFYVDNAGDTVSEAGGSGIDTIRSSLTTNLTQASQGGGQVENLVLLGTANLVGIGSAIANKLTGNAGGNGLAGGSGDDILLGMAGADTLAGGGGKDTLTGGADNDSFKYTVAAQSLPDATADIIVDFDAAGMGNDRIDLSAVYAGTLTYRGALGFTAAGQINIVDIAGPDILVQVNTAGTLAPEMQIRLANTTAASMGVDDFVL